MTIKLPNLDSFISPKRAMQLKSILSLHSDPKVKFDLEAVRKCQPMGMLVVGLAIRDVLYGKEISIEGLNRINEYAGSMCFYDFIGIKEVGVKVNSRPGTSNHIPITIVDRETLLEDCKRDNIEFIDSLRKYSLRIARVLSKEHEDTEIAFEYLIREMLRNIFEHSKSKCAYICGQYWPSHNLTEIAIADDGIGLTTSLKSNMNYVNLVENDSTAIEFALTPGISKSFNKSNNPFLNPDNNSGFGLYVVSELCIALKGSFHIVSGSKSKYVGANTLNDKIIVREQNSNHKGTAVMMRIRPTNLDDFENIFDKIIEEGEIKARQNKIAFSEASSLSRKLSRDLSK